MVEIRLMGGALGRPAASPNAVAGRERRLLGVRHRPGVPELAQVVPAIGKGVLGALTPWASPVNMINFLGDVSGPEEVARGLPAGDVPSACAEVKHGVDPAGIFSFGHAF